MSVVKTEEVDVKTDPFGRELEDVLTKYGKTAYIVLGVDEAGLGFSMVQGTGPKVVTLLYTLMIEYPWAFMGLYEAIIQMSIDVATTEAAMEAISGKADKRKEQMIGKSKSPPAVMGSAKF